MTKEFSVNRLDAKAFAQQAGHLESNQTLAQYPRLRQEDLRGVQAGAEPVHWTLDGEWRAATGAAGQPWLHLKASTVLHLQCQRCLQPTAVAIATERTFRFVKDEATAAALDDVCEEDLLVLQPQFDAQELVEDELLMALPMVPMHETCPVGVQMSATSADFGEGSAATQANPFAALASLRLGGDKS